MNCDQVRDLLGRFHDGELASEKRAAVGTHLATCTTCTAELTALVELSELARTLCEPEPPGDLWDRLALRFGEIRRPRPKLARRALRFWKAAAVAALVLIALATGWFAHKMVGPAPRGTDPAQNASDEGAPHLDDFLAAATAEPLSPEEAARHVDLRLLSATKLPDGYCLEGCCLCGRGNCDVVACKFIRGSDRILLVQGSPHHPIQYGHRPVVETQINGKAASVVQCDGCLACCWQCKGMSLTLVGPRELPQLARLVAHIDHHLESSP